MTNPVFEAPEEPPLVTRRILPVYPLTGGLSNRAVSKAIAQALESCGTPPEILPQSVREQYGILPAETAYRAIHRPSDSGELDQTRRRLVFEEFFLFSAGLSLMRARRTVQHVPVYQNLNCKPFYTALPFPLTGAQRRAIEEITGDLRRGSLMNRLLQGDVGSGKTVVAAAAAYCAAQNGAQTALMAPTEILAEQHYRSLAPCWNPWASGACCSPAAFPPVKNGGSAWPWPEVRPSWPSGPTRCSLKAQNLPVWAWSSPTSSTGSA